MSSRREGVQWMYEGAHSTVQTEEYLTGRKIDKAFDKYASNGKSDCSQLENVSSQKSTTKYSNFHSTTVLDLDTIKKEDPLVAMRVREEQVRREIFENPLKMKRLQKIVMEAMRKKMKKMAKTGDIPDFLKTYFVSMQNNEDEKSSDSDNSKRGSSVKNRARHFSNSDEDQEKKKSDKFGLVYPNGKVFSNQNHHKSVQPERDIQKSSPKHNRHATSKQKLSEKEKERKRHEMIENAKWREEQRYKRQKRDAEEQKNEEKMAKDEKRGAQFLKPLVAGAMQSITVEDRIRSKKHSIQRRHDSMDSNFIKK